MCPYYLPSLSFISWNGSKINDETPNHCKLPLDFTSSRDSKYSNFRMLHVRVLTALD